MSYFVKLCFLFLVLDHMLWFSGGGWEDYLWLCTQRLSMLVDIRLATWVQFLEQNPIVIVYSILFIKKFRWDVLGRKYEHLNLVKRINIINMRNAGVVYNSSIHVNDQVESVSKKLDSSEIRFYCMNQNLIWFLGESDLWINRM